MLCRNCGKKLTDGASFCGSCGTAVGKSSAAASGPAESPAPASPPASSTPPPPASPPPEPSAPPPPDPAAPPQPDPAQTPPPAFQQPQQTPPPRYGQTAFQQGSVPAYAAAPRQNQPNIALLLIIALLGALVLIAAVLLFIKPGYLLHRDNGGGSSSLAEIVEIGGTSAPVSRTDTETAALAAVTDAQPAAETTQPADVTAQNTQEPPAEPPESDVPQNSPGSSGNNALDEAWNASTSARPTFEEFEWCYGQNGFVYQMPEFAERITDMRGVFGGWKAMVIYNPTNAGGTFMRELDNVVIGINGSDVSLSIDWYLMAEDSSESYSEEDMPDSIFNGYVTDTGIYVMGDSIISIDSFWKDGGKQYAAGTLTTTDGLEAYIALVRP